MSHPWHSYTAAYIRKHARKDSPTLSLKNVDSTNPSIGDFHYIYIYIYIYIYNKSLRWLEILWQCVKVQKWPMTILQFYRQGLMHDVYAKRENLTYNPDQCNYKLMLSTVLYCMLNTTYCNLKYINIIHRNDQKCLYYQWCCNNIFLC